MYFKGEVYLGSKVWRQMYANPWIPVLTGTGRRCSCLKNWALLLNKVQEVWCQLFLFTKTTYLFTPLAKEHMKIVGLSLCMSHYLCVRPSITPWAYLFLQFEIIWWDRSFVCCVFRPAFRCWSKCTTFFFLLFWNILLVDLCIFFCLLLQIIASY